MTNTPRIAGIGELLWDLLPGGPRLGGTLTNFSVFCARLGNRTDLVSSVGDDAYGRDARSILPQPNLDLARLQTCGHPTGTVAVAFSADDQPSYTFPPDVAWDFIQVTPGLLPVAHSANAVSFGTLAQRHPVSRSTIRSFVGATPPQCVRVCDVNLRMPYCSPEVLGWSMEHATIIKLSDEELPQVFSLLNQLEPDHALGFAGPRDAAHSLLARFPSCALVATTLGAHGSLITTRETASEHPGFPIELVDSVGAGDAFTAGLVHAYLRGASLAQMAEIGNLCGSFVASQPGATPELPSALIKRIAALLGSE
jgi:fructokinase